MKGPLFWILFQRCSAEFFKFLIFWAKWPKPKIASVPTGNVTGRLPRFQQRAGWRCFRILRNTRKRTPRNSHAWSGHINFWATASSQFLLATQRRKCLSPFLCDFSEDFWPLLAPFLNNQPLQPVFCLLIQPWGTWFFPAPLKFHFGIFRIVVYNVYIS